MKIIRMAAQALALLTLAGMIAAGTWGQSAPTTSGDSGMAKESSRRHSRSAHHARTHHARGHHAHRTHKTSAPAQ